MKAIYATLTAALLACASTAQAQITPDGPTLRKIAETGAISLGVREQTVPFSYLDDRQNFVGYSIDLCQAVVQSIQQHLGLARLEVKYVPVTPATRIPLLSNGTIDLECATTTNNETRQRQVDFSNTIFLTAGTFISRKDQGLERLEDLRGRVVASTSGSTNLVALNEANQRLGLGMRIVPAKDITEAFLMVSTGRADAFAMDDVVLAALMATARQQGQYVISAEGITPPEPYALMMRKGDAEFKGMVDAAVAAFLQSPAGMENYRKWFEQPVPPNGINLAFPMSVAMLKAYQHPTDSINPADYQ